MPLGKFEAEVLCVIAANRTPESFVAGASVLNQGAESPRTSQDIDLFHDTHAALRDSVIKDRAALAAAGYEVAIDHDAPHFVRAHVTRGNGATRMEWVFDSAFRFFPIEPDPELGYRLNFWDAASNKVLAATSRNAIRDYIDLLELHQKHLSLGSLVWAAAGKDDGLSPGFILEELARLQRYPKEDYDLIRETRPIDAKVLKQIWLEALQEARELVDQVLLDAPYGCFFLNAEGRPMTPGRENLADLRPHFGSVRGCWPRIAED